MDDILFARNLVKGKIAETVFAQMLRQSGESTVLEFGYEKIIPQFIQNGWKEDNGMIETLRTAPDFAVINHKTREVRLVEVKYMQSLRQENVLKFAERMHTSWNPSYLFVATLDGFYFDKINEIIKNKGAISLLQHPQISEEIQNQYLQIIRDFERGK